MIDPTALVFYAVVCGILSVAAPGFGRPWIRLGVGALVGIAAAALLPVIRGAVGL